MCPADVSEQQLVDAQGNPPIQCDACESALHSTTSRTVSFLLLEQLTVPLVGCDDHLDRFASVCGFTTDDTEELLDHLPAGGIRCPTCRLAPNRPGHPVVPVQDGAVAVLACPEHQTEVINRFHTGLDISQQLTESVDSLR